MARDDDDAVGVGGAALDRQDRADLGGVGNPATGEGLHRDLDLKAVVAGVGNGLELCGGPTLGGPYASRGRYAVGKGVAGAERH